MTFVDRDRVAAFLAEGDSAKTMTERGRALEDLIAYLFGLVPGVVVSMRNAMNAFHSEEIDVAFWNDGDPKGLRFFDHLLLVECKNWSAPVNSRELAVFDHKLAGLRPIPKGVLCGRLGLWAPAGGI